MTPDDIQTLSKRLRAETVVQFLQLPRRCSAWDRAHTPCSGRGGVVGGRGAAQEALPAICPGSGAGARRGLTPPGHRALLVFCVLEH